MKVSVLLLGLAALVFGCATAVATVSPAPSAAASAPAPEQAQKESALHIEVLKAQVEQAKSFQDALLSTVWWSLGVVVVIAFALVSFSWWNNSRNYDRDKAAIRDEISNKLASMLVEYQEKVNERLLEAEKTFSDRFNSLTDSLRNRVDEGIEKASIAHAASIVALETQLTDFQKANAQQLMSQRFDSLEVRHIVHQQSQSYGAALIVLSELLPLALKRGDFWVERTLGFLFRAIPPFEGKMQPPMKDRDKFIADILDALTQIPDALKPMGDALTERLKALPPA